MMMMFILFLLVNKTICLFKKKDKKRKRFNILSKYIFLRFGGCVSRTVLYILRQSLCKFVNDNFTYGMREAALS